jgi:CheY-like chemotaxis protein
MFKILFIDDEISILEVTKLLLSSLRFEGYFVNSGKLATELLSDKFINSISVFCVNNSISNLTVKVSVGVKVYG